MRTIDGRNSLLKSFRIPRNCGDFGTAVALFVSLDVIYLQLNDYYLSI